MAYNTKAIKTDVNGNPISQYYNPETDEYEPVEGASGGNKVIIYNEDGTPNNSLNFGEILDKLDQLTGTVIAEQHRQQNEAIRQQNEQQRIDLYNALKDLDVSQYELRLQNVENQVNIDNFLLEEWDEPVIPLPSNATNGQINDINIFGNTETEEDNVKSTICAIRLKSVNEDESKESTLYILGKDEEGNILELRSLPNGTKDEVNTVERKAIFRTKKKILESNDVVSIRDNYTNITYAVVQLPKDFINYGRLFLTTNGSIMLEDYIAGEGTTWDDSTRIGKFYGNAQVNYIWVGFAKGTTLEQARQQLTGKALIYQLAEPIEIPIEVFGNLQSYENGTVYVDTIIPKVSFYDGANGIQVTVPIKAIDTLYKVDKETGYLHPLDISQAVIAEDRLSFTHPDLSDRDLADWDYVPDVEGTNPTILMKLPTNLKASVTSTLQGVQELSNKTKKLDTRVITNRRDIEWNKIKLGILEDEFNEHIENKDNPHNITPEQIGALKQEDFNIHLSENSGKHITESGENENGRYIKFDDGTIICYMTKPINYQTELQTISFVYPAAIRSYGSRRQANKNVSFSISSTTGYEGPESETIVDNPLITGFNVTHREDGTGCTVRVAYDRGSTTREVDLMVTVIGRWK